MSHSPLEDAEVHLGKLLGWVGRGWLMSRSLSRLPVLRFPRLWARMVELESSELDSDKGFDNPMFDVVSHHRPET